MNSKDDIISNTYQDISHNKTLNVSEQISEFHAFEFSSCRMNIIVWDSTRKTINVPK